MSKVDIKKSFRVAYNFMETHLGTTDLRAFCADMRDTIAENKDDPLACRLISGIYDYICAESEKVMK